MTAALRLKQSLNQNHFIKIPFPRHLHPPPVHLHHGPTWSELVPPGGGPFRSPWRCWLRQSPLCEPAILFLPLAMPSLIVPLFLSEPKIYPIHVHLCQTYWIQIIQRNKYVFKYIIKYIPVNISIKIKNNCTHIRWNFSFMSTAKIVNCYSWECTKKLSEFIGKKKITRFKLC